MTILDNRGICQHSGLCTDRLATVFRLGTEPFVAASGGRMDEIIRAARDCPQRVAMWLAEVFGGPASYSERCGAYADGYSRMIAQHIGKGLTEEKRARWAMLLLASAQEAGLPNDSEFRAAFSSYIEWGSRLAVENSQPGAKPPPQMPMPRWDWTTAAGPPGSRVSALDPAAGDERPAVLPGSSETVTFETHVATFFRHRDRQSMRFAFDLWSYDDVKDRAHAILARLRDGSMPCDGSWPAKRIDAFERWITTGMRP